MYDIDNLLDQIQQKMQAKEEYFKKLLAGFRTGKASPALVDSIKVDCYGSKMNMKDIASISTPEPRLIVIQPWDSSTLPAIVKAIIAEDMGVNPVNDGQLVRLPLPELSEDRRKEMVKQLKAKSEEMKIDIRNIRRDGNDFAKKSQKNGDITEDDLKDILDDIQKSTDSYITKITDIANNKEKELMTI